MKKIKILRSTTFWRSFFWVNLSFFSAIFKTVTQYPLLHIVKRDIKGSTAEEETDSVSDTTAHN